MYDKSYCVQGAVGPLIEASIFFARSDVMPENITAATDTVPHFNLLPVYGK